MLSDSQTPLAWYTGLALRLHHKLCRRHTNQAAIQQFRADCQRLLHRPVVPELDGLEGLEEAEDGVRNLRDGELLADADARAAGKWEILPAVKSSQHAFPARTPPPINSGSPSDGGDSPATQLLPPLGSELLGVLAVDIAAPLHAPRRPPDGCTLRDEHGLLPVRSAPHGQHGIPTCTTRHCRDRRVEAEGCKGCRSANDTVWFLAEV